MRDYPDATILLRTLMEEYGHAFDPDSAVARASLERILATPPLTTTRQRRPSTRRMALAAVPVVVAAAAIAVAPSLNGSRTGTAQAAMILRVFRNASDVGPPLPKGFAAAFAPAGPLGKKFGLLPSSTVYVENTSLFGVWLTPGTRGMCIVAPTPDGGHGGSCASTADALAGDLRVRIGSDGVPVSMFGVAPDGDMTVTVTYLNSATKVIRVVHNVYVIPDANTATTVTLRTAAGVQVKKSF